MLIEMDPLRPQPQKIKKIVSTLINGGIIIYPTDTCYGIGADIFNKKAIERIYTIKGVPKTTPFSFVCCDLTDISKYARVSDYAYRVLKRLLPGPYTFILEGSKQVPKMMLTKRHTVGIRLPDHPICLAITKELGHPLLSASASFQNSDVFSDPREMAQILGKQVDIIVDCGLIYPEPSSVVSLVDDEPEILREGKGDISEF